MRYSAIKKCSEHLLAQIPFDRNSLSLGSVGGWETHLPLTKLEKVHSVLFDEIPGISLKADYPIKGGFDFYSIDDNIIVHHPRSFFYYQGYSMEDLALPIRLLKFMGLKRLIISEECGLISPHSRPGEILLVKDHINLLGDNPLIGPNENSIGSRFPNMAGIYSESLCAIALSIAHENNVSIREVVISPVVGPHLVTPAQQLFLKNIRAEGWCFSLVPEAIAAAHAEFSIVATGVNCQPGSNSSASAQSRLENPIDYNNFYIELIKALSSGVTDEN
ncbi:hypothetical protein JW877_03885 [bacterium]|nr:hypothetical protein [bacterium]